jgi:hypothetical protein
LEGGPGAQPGQPIDKPFDRRCALVVRLVQPGDRLDRLLDMRRKDCLAVV